MIDLMAIIVEKPKKNNGCSLEKELSESIM